jgi:hypothetical protein
MGIPRRPLHVRCPRCGQLAGQACDSRTKAPHAERVAAFQKVVRELERLARWNASCRPTDDPIERYGL